MGRLDTSMGRVEQQANSPSPSWFPFQEGTEQGRFKEPAVLPQPSPQHVHPQDQDGFGAAAVALDGVQRGPEGLGGHVQPDDRPTAAALAAPAVAFDAREVAPEGARRSRRGPIPSRPRRPGRKAMPRPVSVHELKGALVPCARVADEGRDTLPIRLLLAANCTGPEVRS